MSPLPEITGEDVTAAIRYLDVVRKRTAAASPGPWEHTVDQAGRGDPLTTGVWCGHLSRYITEQITSGYLHIQDGMFIAGARSDVPRLVLAVTRACRRHRAEMSWTAALGESWYCTACPGRPAWPCEEVQDMTAALLGRDARPLGTKRRPVAAKGSYGRWEITLSVSVQVEGPDSIAEAIREATEPIERQLAELRRSLRRDAPLRTAEITGASACERRP